MMDMGWQQTETTASDPAPDRTNQPDSGYAFRSKGYIERSILQLLTVWDEDADEFRPGWLEGKPTQWLFRPIAAVRDPGMSLYGGGDEFTPDPSLEASVRRALARLEDRGLIERGDHPDDARQVVWNVTDAGVTEAAMLADRFAVERSALRKRYGVVDDAHSVLGGAAWDWLYQERHVETEGEAATDGGERE